MNQHNRYFQWNRTLLSVIGGIWALPNTAIGLVLGIIGCNRWQLHQGTIEILLGKGPVRYVCHKLRISAFTLGDCVFYNVEPCKNLREHEGRHTRQYWVLGPFFLPAYFALMALRGYYDHPFEQDARNWEHRQCGCLYRSKIVQDSSGSDTTN